jgi:hypothetical protein
MFSECKEGNDFKQDTTHCDSVVSIALQLVNVNSSNACKGLVKLAP